MKKKGERIKNKSIFVLVAVLLLSLGAVPAFADEAYLTPYLTYVVEGDRVNIEAHVDGDWSVIQWQACNTSTGVWEDSSRRNVLTYTANVNSAFYNRKVRIKVIYLNEDVLYSNEVYVLLNNVGDGQISLFESFGTDLVNWFIAIFSPILGWILVNPVVLVFFVLAFIISVIGILRHMIGGKNEKDSDPDYYSI